MNYKNKDPMTFEEIKDKYLFSFCDFNRGPVLVCCVVKIFNSPSHLYPFVINFLSCTDVRKKYDLNDNLFFSYDGINFSENNYHIKPARIEDRYIKSFIKRLFENSSSDFLIQEVLRTWE